MSDTIQGARTRNYVKENIPGIQNSGDTLEYATIQEAPGKRGALDAVIHGSFTVSTAHIIEAGSVKRLIKSTAHGAQKGWIMRPSSGASKGEEIAIVNVVDANTFVIAEEFDLALADTFSICRLITPNYTEAGDLNVVVTASGPVQYLKDTVITTVSEDTVIPANNEALPSKMFIQKDGVTIPVNKDTGVPGNTVAVPVEIVAASGTEINITAGDINIQTTSEGGSFDSMRIGSGVGLYAGITANSELSVHDQDVLDELSGQTTLLSTITTEVGEINTKTPDLGQALEAASVPVVLPATQVTALTPPAAITGFNLETTQLDVKAAVESLNTKLPAQGQALESASTPVVLPVAQVTALTPPAAITGFNLEATQLLIQAKTDNLDIPLSDISAKLPAALGPDAGAASLSIVPATDAEFTVVQKAPALPGSDDSQNVNHTSGYTFTKPIDAKNMVIFNNAGDPVANRIRFGQAPDWAMGLGAILGVGNSTALLPASSFKALSENADSNANVTVLWFY